MTEKQIPITKTQTEKDKEKENEDLTQEDLLTKERLEEQLQKLQDKNVAISTQALNLIKDELRSSTSSITAIPKPLKFLIAHRDTIEAFYNNVQDGPLKKNISELLSVLYICEANEERKSLKQLVDNSLCESMSVIEWGLEYLRLLISQVTTQIAKRVMDNESFTELSNLSLNIAQFFTKEGLFFESVDVLYEINKLHEVIKLTNKDNQRKICDQLLQCNKQSSEFSETEETLKIIGEIYKTNKDRINYLRMLIKLNSKDNIKELMETIQKERTDESHMEMIQCCFLLARNNCSQVFEAEDEKLNDILHNKQILEYQFLLAKNLDVAGVKTPKQIYKKHLEDTKNADKLPESAMDNLADTFVNAFVNLAFQKDGLLVGQGDEWVFKNKDRNKMIAVGSLGLVFLWDTEKSMEQLDKYQQVEKDLFVQAGYQLGLGISASATGNLVDSDLVLEMVRDKLDSNPNETIVLAILVGLSLAQAGSCRSDVTEIFQKQILNFKLTAETASICILGLGIINCGSCDFDLATLILTQMMEAPTYDKSFVYVSLSLGIICLGQQSKAETIYEVIESIGNESPESESFKSFTQTMVDSLAWTSSGSIVHVQKNLNKIYSICKEHEEKKQEKKLEELSKKDDKDKRTGTEQPDTKAKDIFKDYEIQACVIGMTLVCQGEQVSSELILRSQDHIIQYGSEKAKQVIPLSIALLNLSNPKFTMVDVLSRQCQQHDVAFAMNAIVALGLVGFGTNNSRIASILRSLAEYQAREGKTLQAVRLAQGLLHAGKGLVSISPLNSVKLITNIPALSGIITLLFSCLDMENTLLGDQSQFLFQLVPSIKPRWLVTVDQDCNPIKLQMKIGSEVDTVGLQGNPKTVTGFQIQETPLILGQNDRAEIVNHAFEKEGQEVFQQQILEDIIVVKKVNKVV